MPITPDFTSFDRIAARGAVWGPETSHVLSNTWTLVLAANAARRFLLMAPATTNYDAYWSTDPTLLGTSNSGGFPLQSGENFNFAPSVAPTDAIYMRSAAGETVTTREGN